MFSSHGNQSIEKSFFWAESQKSFFQHFKQKKTANQTYVWEWPNDTILQHNACKYVSKDEPFYPILFTISYKSQRPLWKLS